MLDTGTEREILVSRLEYAVEHVWRELLTSGPGGEPGEFALSSTAVPAVLRAMRVMSARQLAVLLADEADRKAATVIEEPPRYTAEEIANVS